MFSKILKAIVSVITAGVAIVTAISTIVNIRKGYVNNNQPVGSFQPSSAITREIESPKYESKVTPLTCQQSIDDINKSNIGSFVKETCDAVTQMNKAVSNMNTVNGQYMSKNVGPVVFDVQKPVAPSPNQSNNTNTYISPNPPADSRRNLVYNNNNMNAYPNDNKFIQPGDSYFNPNALPADSRRFANYSYRQEPVMINNQAPADSRRYWNQNPQQGMVNQFNQVGDYRGSRRNINYNNDPVMNYTYPWADNTGYNNNINPIMNCLNPMGQMNHGYMGNPTPMYKPINCYEDKDYPWSVENMNKREYLQQMKMMNNNKPKWGITDPQLRQDVENIVNRKIVWNNPPVDTDKTFREAAEECGVDYTVDNSNPTPDEPQNNLTPNTNDGQPEYDYFKCRELDEKIKAEKMKKAGVICPFEIL